MNFKIFFTVAILSATALHTTATAQDFTQQRPPHQNRGERPMPEIKTPKEVATQRTAEMDTIVGLSKKQYKKIYKIYLSEEKSRLDNMAVNQPFGGRPPHGNMFGEPPHGMGNPPEGFQGRPPHDMQPPKPVSDDEMRAKTEKKIRKVLTDEQYVEWLKYLQEKARLQPFKEKHPQ